LCSKLSRTWRHHSSTPHFDDATPITGTVSWPFFTTAYSAGKIFLPAGSPLKPKATRASECGRSAVGPVRAATLIGNPRRASRGGRRQHDFGVAGRTERAAARAEIDDHGAAQLHGRVARDHDPGASLDAVDMATEGCATSV